MRTAIVQISPHLGDVEKNLELHIDWIAKSRSQGAELVVFPELSLTGYTLKDLTPEVALRPEESAVFAELKKAARDTSLVVGFIEEKDNGLFYNSAAFLSRGGIDHIHRKVFLPTYGMFEELKFFAQGRNFKTFSSPFAQTGLMICYDFLHYGASYLLFAGGSDLIIVLSAAPGRGFAEEETFGTSHMWELMGETISRFSSAFVIYCNRVGFEDGKAFAGGSFVYGPRGDLIGRASYADEELLLVDIDLEELRRIRKIWPYRRDEKPEIVLEALRRIVSSYED